MKNLEIPQLGDIVLLRISLMYGKLKDPDDLGYNTYQFKVISYYDGEGVEQDRQVLVTPVDEKFLIDGSQSFSAFNALAFKNMVYDAKHFTCVKDIDSYHNKLSAWVYLSHICEIVRPIIDSANDGCFCNSCKEWYYMAISNQPDGTMICYSCRSNPLRMFY